MPVEFTPNTVIAHRGASAYYPENTLLAFEKAIAFGVSWVEFDVMLTQDGHCVVHHDFALGRTAKGDSLIHELTLAECQMLDVGSWFDRQYRDCRIPSLAEVLKLFVNTPVNLNLELKAKNDDDFELLVNETIHQVRQHWLDKRGWPLLSCFKEEVVSLLRATDETIPRGQLFEDYNASLVETLTDAPPFAVGMHHTCVTHEIITHVKQVLDCYCLAFTVNDRQRANKLFACGVDAIFSDRPDLMVNHE